MIRTLSAACAVAVLGLVALFHVVPASAGGAAPICDADETGYVLANKAATTGSTSIKVPAGEVRISSIETGTDQDDPRPFVVYLCVKSATTHKSTEESNLGPLVGIGVVAIVLVGAFLYGARRPRSSPS